MCQSRWFEITSTASRAGALPQRPHPFRPATGTGSRP